MAARRAPLAEIVACWTTDVATADGPGTQIPAPGALPVSPGGSGEIHLAESGCAYRRARVARDAAAWPGRQRLPTGERAAPVCSDTASAAGVGARRAPGGGRDGAGTGRRDSRVSVVSRCLRVGRRPRRSCGKWCCAKCRAPLQRPRCCRCAPSPPPGWSCFQRRQAAWAGRCRQ